MVDNETFRQNVKDRHGFDQWTVYAKSADAPSLTDFTLDSDAFPELVFEKRLPLPGGGGYRAHEDYFRMKDAKDEVVVITISHTPSVEAAHEGLVDILTNCMAMNLRPAQEAGINAGHVGFVGYGDTVKAIYFVRGSTLVRIDSIGRDPVDVSHIAEQIDDQLASASHG